MSAQQTVSGKLSSKPRKVDINLRDADSLSLEELCGSLSARVLPRRAYFTNDGDEKSDKEVKTHLSKSRQIKDT